MERFAPFIVPIAAFGFVSFWCLICWLLGLLGGWRRLARRFPAPGQRPKGQAFWFESAYLGGVSFQGAINFIVAPEGLHISVLPLFRPGHPPLLIPWHTFKPFREEKNLWIMTYETEIALEKFDNIGLSIGNRKLKAAMHAQAYEVSQTTIDTNR